MSEVRQRLPEDLELLPPGPQLTTLLGSIDRTALSDKDRVRLMQARHRLASHVQAELYADIHAVSWSEPSPDDDDDDGFVPGDAEPQPYPWAETEISMALRWTRTAAGIRLEQARRMIEDLPAVHTALAEGRIDVPKALLISDLLQPLPLDTARQLAVRVLEKAPEQTTGQLRARLRRLVLAADPDAFTTQAAADAPRRQVRAWLEDNNLASLIAEHLAPHRVAAGWERLEAIAAAAKAAGDPRRIDELRADALLDLLIGEGIALGGPISNGNPYAPPEPGDMNPRETPPWPTAPADPTLLDPAADPTGTTPAEDSRPPPAAPPPRPPRIADETDEQLRAYWLGQFYHLPDTRDCPRCRAAAQPAGPLPAPRRGTLDIQIPLSTLAGLDNLPAELAGFGPLLADAARHVIAARPDLQWRISVYDDDHHLISHNVTHTRPQQRQRTRRRRAAATDAAYVRARNRTCIHPTCRRNARRCELDHVLAWTEHGDTDPDNLAPECKRDHTFKHYPGSKLTHLGNGTFQWTTPRGMHYTTEPDPPLYTDVQSLPPTPNDDPKAEDR